MYLLLNEALFLSVLNFLYTNFDLGAHLKSEKSFCTWKYLVVKNYVLCWKMGGNEAFQEDPVEKYYFQARLYLHGNINKRCSWNPIKIFSQIETFSKGFRVLSS